MEEFLSLDSKPAKLAEEVYKARRSKATAKGRVRRLDAAWFSENKASTVQGAVGRARTDAVYSENQSIILALTDMCREYAGLGDEGLAKVVSDLRKKAGNIHVLFVIAKQLYTEDQKKLFYEEMSILQRCMSDAGLLPEGSEIRRAFEEYADVLVSVPELNEGGDVKLPPLESYVREANRSENPAGDHPNDRANKALVQPGTEAAVWLKDAGADDHAVHLAHRGAAVGFVSPDKVAAGKGVCLATGEPLPLNAMASDHVHPKEDIIRRINMMVRAMQRWPAIRKKMLDESGYGTDRDLGYFKEVDGIIHGTEKLYAEYTNAMGNLWYIAGPENTAKGPKHPEQYFKGNPFFGQAFLDHIGGINDNGILLKGNNGVMLADAAKNWMEMQYGADVIARCEEDMAKELLKAGRKPAGTDSADIRAKATAAEYRLLSLAFALQAAKARGELDGAYYVRRQQEIMAEFSIPSVDEFQARLAAMRSVAVSPIPVKQSMQAIDRAGRVGPGSASRFRDRVLAERRSAAAHEARDVETGHAGRADASVGSKGGPASRTPTRGAAVRTPPRSGKSAVASPSPDWRAASLASRSARTPASGRRAQYSGLSAQAAVSSGRRQPRRVLGEALAAPPDHARGARYQVRSEPHRRPRSRTAASPAGGGAIGGPWAARDVRRFTAENRHGHEGYRVGAGRMPKPSWQLVSSADTDVGREEVFKFSLNQVGDNVGLRALRVGCSPGSSGSPF